MGKDSQNLCKSNSRKNKQHFICTQAVQTITTITLLFYYAPTLDWSLKSTWAWALSFTTQCVQLQFTAVNTCVYTATPIVKSLHMERASLKKIWFMYVVWKPNTCINVSPSGSLHHSGLREAEGCWCHSATDREGCCWIQQTSPPGYQSGRSLPLHLLMTLHLPYCTNQDTHLNAFIVVSLFHLKPLKHLNVTFVDFSHFLLLCCKK